MHCMLGCNLTGNPTHPKAPLVKDRALARCCRHLVSLPYKGSRHCAIPKFFHRPMTLICTVSKSRNFPLVQLHFFYDVALHLYLYFGVERHLLAKTKCWYVSLIAVVAACNSLISIQCFYSIPQGCLIAKKTLNQGVRNT